jgi:hypothetical protein
MPAERVRLEPVMSLDLGQKIGQLRAVPVSLGKGQQRALLAIYGADFEIDPFVEMFFFPTDTLKMVLFTPSGEVLWRRDLGKGVVPGIWFCPVFAFDLDGDGVDEIWYVGNVNAQHPLGLSGYRLERVDARTGRTTGQWQWPNHGGNPQSLSHLFRNFIFGGHAAGEPVLVTAQGTYGSMFLQAYGAGAGGELRPRWEVRIPADAPGARGSHMCAIADLDADGVQEVLWGERCIELGAGRELFCADRDSYRGHSDIAQPVYDRATGRRYLYTCREQDPRATPRVALYDARGERVWGDLDHGHMDIGWVARLGHDRARGGPGPSGGADGATSHEGGIGEYVAMSIRIGQKSAGPDGRHHQSIEEFAWDAFTGAPHRLPFSGYRTIPVDLNGDGFHEIARGQPSGDGEVWDRFGNRIGNVGGPVAMASKFLDGVPGEQLLSYAEDGTVRIWADRNARDGEHALRRYACPEYAANQRQTAVGYGLINLAGL